jgi:tRNA threonylcarbamoyl adenosine modification protein (Sua5/YciO/YrdC/YwlC family)
MNEHVSVEIDGAEAARKALERSVGAGGVAVFPSDGLYGLACDPLNETAVERIHELKGRPARKSAAVMYFARLAMRELLGDLGERTSRAVAALLPGPVTLVLPNPRHRYPLACREDPARLGVRLIEGPLAGTRTPVFQTSANVSGDPPPAAPGELDQQIAAGADLVIDGGALSGAPSTVIDLSRFDADDSWEILREGALPAPEAAGILESI